MRYQGDSSDQKTKMRENKGTRHDVHFNDEYTLDLSGALGAKSQQEIREHFDLIITVFSFHFFNKFFTF